LRKAKKKMGSKKRRVKPAGIGNQDGSWSMGEGTTVVRIKRRGTGAGERE